MATPETVHKEMFACSKKFGTSYIGHGSTASAVLDPTLIGRERVDQVSTVNCLSGRP